MSFEMFKSLINKKDAQQIHENDFARKKVTSYRVAVLLQMKQKP